jgi:hypothetical protein
MLMIGSQNLRTFRFIGGGPTLLHLHSGLAAQSVTNGVMWTSIHGSLEATPMEALAVGLGWVRLHHLTHISI